MVPVSQSALSLVRPSATVSPMTQTVAVPLWLLILILLFAAVTFASHFLFPSVRWFFRKRMERGVARLNERLARPIQPFKLAARHDTIERLIYHPAVTEAVVEHAEREGVPESVAFQLARRYAREIVPSFSVMLYFSVGTRLAKWISRALYRIRLGAQDRSLLDRIDPQAAVVFVMNHRSNMDYVLVTYLVARASALSYAVGEWARVWPLSPMIRAMGAYFIRRQDRGRLYRRVLARYVQMATEGGVTQAIFPEGGLSLDGRIAAPKLGILSYIIEGFQPGQRDVVFVPVGLNYDRVLEDRFLIKAGQSGQRRFRPPLGAVLGGVLHHLWLRLTGRFDGFGTAAVRFGEPLSLAGFLAGHAVPPVEAVGEEIMARVAEVVPVLAVPLLARALAEGEGEETELRSRMTAMLGELGARGVDVPAEGAAALASAALAQVLSRGIVERSGPRLKVTPGQEAVLAYYANTIAHHFPQTADPATAGTRVDLQQTAG
jgi:glycerol-3-phosphate O-acyltransferase